MSLNRHFTRRRMLAAGAVGLAGVNLLRQHQTHADEKPGVAKETATQPAPSPFDKPARGYVLEPGDPETVDLSRARLQKISEKLRKETSNGEVMSASVLIARRGVIVLHEGFGRLRPDRDAPQTQPESIYLLASITKPVTACCLMLLVERGQVALMAPVSRYLREFRGEERNDVRVWHLLSHVSGLPDQLPENFELRRANAPLKQFVQQATRAQLLFKPGAKFSYQSMGTLLAGEIVERVSGLRLREFMQKELFGPLGMQHSTLGLKCGDKTLKIEETAAVQSLVENADTRIYGPNTPYWRDFGHPWGGLHSSTGDLAILLQCILNRGVYREKELFAPVTTEAMISDRNHYLNSPFGLGWALKGSLAASHFGDLCSSRTFGHVGATGTVAWADPVRRMICVLLTSQPQVCTDGRLLDEISNLAQASVVSL